MEIVYQDKDICVVIKPARVLSTDEPGGVPELLRSEFGEPKADVLTVHRLDRVVGGLMVLARNARAASELSRQIRENEFEKEYCAVVHGCPSEELGTFRDFLWRDKARKMSFVTDEKVDAQEAILHYSVEQRNTDSTFVRIQLVTGRTHQIRVQFASRGMPLFGERKYSTLEDPCELALWSSKLVFKHPGTGEWLSFEREPPCAYPWCEGKDCNGAL